jgi:hypothetical protein
MVREAKAWSLNSKDGAVVCGRISPPTMAAM